MKRRNATRKALFASVVSLLLCVSMLVGTTFAWFTDEVVTGMNTIAAGNLDVELLADGQNVNSDTKLFDDVELWEPGVVAYENLQVANVGTLALKYQMALNFGNENDLHGHKLSEVLKVAAIDKIADNATRAEVMAAAKAADADSLSNFYLSGALEAGAVSDEKTIVVFWEPNDNETDNLYNANNGQVTSDGKPLHIEFGINLQATQQMHEEDSFGPDYDKFATILPKAKVKNLGAKTVSATTNEWGSGKVATDYNAPFVLQFQPNETLDEANVSAYKYWHADYVVSADKDVPANSIALLGYYKAFCEDYNDGKWVALSADQTIPAGDKVRLVDAMGGGDGSGTGSIKVTYKDICQWGNDNVGFLCSATDLTGENAGTTITVELRMYANESDPADSSYNNGDETGEYYVIGTYTYTFKNEVSTAEELQAAINNGDSNITLGANLAVNGENMITVPTGADVTIDLNGHNISADFADKTDGGSAIFTVDKNASLTINGNGNVHAVAAPTTSYVSAIFVNLGTLEVNGGNYSMTYGTYAEGYLIPTIIDTNSNIGKATTTINGGTFTHNRNMFRNFAQPLRGENNATLIINGGTFIGEADDFGSIWNQKTSSTGVEGDGIVTINGGDFQYMDVCNDFETGVTIAAGLNIAVQP